MKTMTKNLLIAATLGLITTSAFSQVNGRDNDRRTRARDRHRDMNVCAEIKQDVIAAEDAYVGAANRISAANNRISQEKDILRSRRNTLERKKTSYETASRQVRDLTQLKADKPRLMAENNRSLNDANAQLPGLRTVLDAAKAEKKNKCKGAIRFGKKAKRCKAAKKALKNAENSYNSMSNQKVTATNTIDRLNRVESDLSRVEGIKSSAASSLSQEESMTPSIASLSTAVRQLVNRRNDDQIAFDQIENDYGRLELRLEKCQNMRYDARNGRAFKRALLVFAKNNAQGCDRAVTLIRNAKGPAAKDGINEAYELVCNSDILVRTVEAPVVRPAVQPEPMN